MWAFTPDFIVISIHAAREGGDHANKSPLVNGAISIHAAREGGDHVSPSVCDRVGISIHAAREGGDIRAATATSDNSYFNPRRP